MHRVFLSAKLTRLTVVKVSYGGQYNRVWVAYIHPRSVHSTLLTLTLLSATDRSASASRPVPAGLSLLSNPLSPILFYSILFQPALCLFIPLAAYVLLSLVLCCVISFTISYLSQFTRT